MMCAPKAFLSHSHEDKPIAERLAAALRERGVDAWLDKWEIKPGDSLIQKIFEEGLKNCDVFIILLSPESVRSNWVRYELDAALVQRLSGATRVVPVVVKRCDIPVALRPLFRLDLSIDGEEHSVDRLVDVAFGRDRKPPLGPPPSDFNLSVSGLTNNAARIAVLLAESMDQPDGSPRAYSGEELAGRLALDAEQVNDAVEELDAMGLVRLVKWLGTAPYHFGQVEPADSLAFHLRGSGVLDYDPEQDVLQIAAAVVQLKSVDGAQLKDVTGLPPSRINRAVSYLDDFGLADVTKLLGTAPYDFGLIAATGATRRFVAENS